MCTAALAAGCAAAGNRTNYVYFPAPPAPARAVHIKSFNTLAELVPLRTGIAELLGGRSLSPYVQVPAGIAYRRGHLYICDTGLGAVHDWDLREGRGRRIGTRGDVRLLKPVGVAVSDSGTLYVADTGRDEVVAFDATGEAGHRFHPPEREAYRPVAVAVRDETLYVSDIAAHQIDVFSISDGSALTTIGAVGSEPGQFYFPMGLATGPDGNLFVADMFNSRVQVFDPSHRLLRGFGQPGDRYGDMGKPRHLAVAADGVVFIADTEFAHVHLFSRDGRLLMLLGGPEDQPGGTPLPVGVAIAPTLPDKLASLVPDDFAADYFLFVSNTVGRKRLSLWAVGSPRTRP